jgi:hypothetical protein
MGEANRSVRQVSTGGRITMKNRKATLASELIKVSIHRLVYCEDTFEKNICGVDVALIPEYRNGLFV